MCLWEIILGKRKEKPKWIYLIIKCESIKKEINKTKDERGDVSRTEGEKKDISYVRIFYI